MCIAVDQLLKRLSPPSDLFFFLFLQSLVLIPNVLLLYPNTSKQKSRTHSPRPAKMGVFSTLCRRLFCIRPSRCSQEEYDTRFEPVVSRVPSVASCYNGGASADSSMRQSEVLVGRPRVYSECGNPFAPGQNAAQRRYLSCEGNPFA